MGALETAKSALIAGNTRAEIGASNMAVSQAVAGRSQQFSLTANRGSGEMSSGNGAVSGTLLKNIAEIGNAEKDGNPLHAALGRKAFFVTDQGFTRVGTWGFNKDGDCVNHLGHKIQCFPVDPLTQVNTNTDISALSYVNKNNINLTAEATANVGVNYNLGGLNTSSKTVADIPTLLTSAADRSTSTNVYDSLGGSHILSVEFRKYDATAVNAAVAVAAGVGGAIAIAGNAVVGGEGDTIAAAALFANAAGTDVSAAISGSGVSAGAIAAAITALGTAVGAAVQDPLKWEVNLKISGTPVQIAGADTASVSFNTDGSINTPAAAINAGPITSTAIWGNGAEDSTIAFDLAYLTNTDSQAQVGHFDIDGHTAGKFKSMEWDENGYGVVTYTNNLQRRQFQIGQARFDAEDQLRYDGAGSYLQSAGSGNAEYGYSGDSFFEKMTPESLERANISEIQTHVDMIGNQRYYMAQISVFKTAREMAQALDNL